MAQSQKARQAFVTTRVGWRSHHPAWIAPVLVVGMVYTYLPFMILPLYANLSKMDLRLLEAASDLGATPWTAFWRITVPLSKAGIIAGAMLVFIPCVGEFVIPELLGGPQTLMIGRVLWDEFFSNNDWPMASAVAVVRRSGSTSAATTTRQPTSASPARMKLNSPICARLAAISIAEGQPCPKARMISSAAADLPSTMIATVTKGKV